MSTALVQTPADTIDLADVGRAVRRGWRIIAAFTVVGLLAAFAVLLFAPPKFSATSSVLVRTSGGNGSSLLSKLAEGAGDPGGMLSGAMKSPIETELEIIGSRAVVGRVIDSLALQAQVTAPRGVGSRELIEAYALPGSFKTGKYEFTKVGANEYHWTGRGASGTAVQGQSALLPPGSLTLQRAGLPQRFALSLRDREEAITRFQKHLSVDKANGGEIAIVTYKGDDSLTAAAATNAIVATYLARR
ncbi:MAG: Wzz/FepE/Etk N-terminal domain-containing protein, partial [Gemmatimonadales bacterium]